MSDGSVTEVAGKNLKEGMQVVIGEDTGSAAGGGEANPFLPNIRFGGRPQGSSGGSGSSSGSGAPGK